MEKLRLPGTIESRLCICSRYRRASHRSPGTSPSIGRESPAPPEPSSPPAPPGERAERGERGERGERAAGGAGGGVSSRRPSASSISISFRPQHKLQPSPADTTGTDSELLASPDPAALHHHGT